MISVTLLLPDRIYGLMERTGRTEATDAEVHQFITGAIFMFLLHWDPQAAREFQQLNDQGVKES